MIAVNTGVGGNSDTRTNETVLLQKALLLHLNTGVIGWDGVSPREHHQSAVLNSTADRDCDPKQIHGIKNAQDGGSENLTNNETAENRIADLLREEVFAASAATMERTTMPEEWVRAAVLVRSNSLARGVSGVTPELLQSLVAILRKGICPVVPLRGSISASGDLAPLSYIAGALAGSPGIRVWSGRGEARRAVRADVALQEAGLVPTALGPKEVISLVNGTAFSAGVAALALHEGHCFAALTQLLTATATEALQGTAESFDEFFSTVRPHPGQVEAARNIWSFLQGSHLLKCENSGPWAAGTQRQDRYALRTAPQWIGPALEELALAHAQVETECNSTTDNPLVDAAGARILHGGNFQAMSATAAAETLRASLLIFGRMLFAQLTELCNPAYSNGLPPNLTADDPSRDFLAKGIDTQAAAYTAELGLLAGRVTPHVLSAEMHNQSINSLALLSARYAFTALDVFATLAATATVALCQALDLRVIQRRFLNDFAPQFRTLTAEALFPKEVPAAAVAVETQAEDAAAIDARVAALWSVFVADLDRVTDRDISARFVAAAGSTLAASHISQDVLAGRGIPLLAPWTTAVASAATTTWLSARDSHVPEDTLPLLGLASRWLYGFVRLRLRVPFLRATMSADPAEPCLLGAAVTDTLGTFVSRVFDTIKDGSLFVFVMAALREAQEGEKRHSEATNKKQGI